MAIDPRILLEGRVPDTSATVSNALLSGQQFRQNQEEQPIRNRLLEAQTQRTEGAASREEAVFQLQDATRDALILKPALAAGDIPEVTRQLENRIEKIQARGGNPKDSLALLERVRAGDFEGANRDLDAVINAAQQVSAGAPAGIREFQTLTQGLSPEDADKARKIELGLEPRATGAASRTVDIGGVPHIFDPVSQTFTPAEVRGSEVTTETVTESEATIAGGKKAAELAIKMSGEALDKLPEVRLAISNVDDAISAIDNGAATGVIQSRLPSVRESSIELDNVRGRLGLDIIAGTTFGNLSEAELDFALDTALPTNLEPPELRNWLVRKKAAQEKLADELERAAIYLGTPGNTPAGYLEFRRNQERVEPTEEETVRFLGFDNG